MVPQPAGFFATLLLFFFLLRHCATPHGRVENIYVFACKEAYVYVCVYIYIYIYIHLALIIMVH